MSSYDYDYEADIKPLEEKINNFYNGIPQTRFICSLTDSLPEGDIPEKSVVFIYQS